MLECNDGDNMTVKVEVLYLSHILDPIGGRSSGHPLSSSSSYVSTLLMGRI